MVPVTLVLEFATITLVLLTFPLSFETAPNTLPFTVAFVPSPTFTVVSFTEPFTVTAPVTFPPTTLSFLKVTRVLLTFPLLLCAPTTEPLMVVMFSLLLDCS